MSKLGSFFGRPLIAWLVLVCGLLITALAWNYFTVQVEQKVQDYLDYRVEEITSALESRVKVYEQVLWGGVGLFRASRKVSRREWAQYVDTIGLKLRWPGIQGLGWTVNATPGEIEPLIQQARVEGLSDFKVHPGEPRESYTVTLFLEPADWRNRRAFGYDMATDAVRERAMTQAMLTGNATTSGKITLLQETDRDIQSGFLTFVPVYHPDRPLKTPEQRRKALRGWVFAAFRAGDLMNGIVAGQDDAMELEVFDGPPTADNLLYKTPGKPKRASSFRYQRTENLSVQGQVWTLRFLGSAGLDDIFEQRLPRIVALTGVIVNLLLFGLISALIGSQRRTEKMVSKRTLELQEQSIVLLKANEDLALSNADLDRFAEIASHDLQEPLRTITSYSQLLIAYSGSNLDADSQEFLNNIIDGSRRMRRLIEDILTFSRAKDTAVEFVTLDCQKMVTGIISDLNDLIQRSQGEVRVANLPTIQASPVFSQVFRNLIVNAIIYCSQTPPRVEVSASQKDGFWVFSVSDNGIGIEPEFRDRVFRLFERLHTQAQQPGSGLGLALCQRLVRAHGGTIWIEDNDPRGSRFLFTLPDREPTRHPAKTAAIPN